MSREIINQMNEYLDTERASSLIVTDLAHIHDLMTQLTTIGDQDVESNEAVSDARTKLMELARKGNLPLLKRSDGLIMQPKDYLTFIFFGPFDPKHYTVIPPRK